MSFSPGALALWIGLFASAVQAQAHPPVRLEVAQCVAVDALEVRRLLALELQGGLLPEGSREASATSVQVTCEAGETRLVVDDPLTGKSLSRGLSLAGHPESARARLLALAAVELVIASWTELVLEPPAEVAELRPEPAAPTRAAAVATVQRFAPELRPVVRRWALGAGGQVRGMFQDLGFAWGVGAHLVYRPRRDLELELGASRATADVDAALGRVEAIHWSGALAAYYRLAWPALSLRFGPRIGVGRVRLLGDSDDVRVTAASVSGLAVEVAGAAGVRVPYARGALVVELFGGAVPVGVRGRVTEQGPLAWGGAFGGIALRLEVWL